MGVIEEIISQHKWKWLEHAAKWLYEHGAATDKDVSHFTDLCKKEANHELIEAVAHPQYFQGLAQDDVQELRLLSISDVEGVNSLAPSKSLKFEGSNITVVYGLNGSGKSSYVRLLKHVCGARIPGKLLSNVYESEKNIQQAKIGFKKDNKDQEVTWSGSGACEELRDVHIFDHSFEDVFVDGDETSYEPPELSFISSLIKICDEVRGKLNTEESKYPSKKPKIPDEYKDSTEGKWFESIAAKTPDEELEKYCAFSEENKKELEGLSSSKDRVENLKNKQKAIDSILNGFQKHWEQFSDEACKRRIDLHRKRIAKKEAADVVTKRAFGDSCLEGIGSDTWKELWGLLGNTQRKKRIRGMSSL